MKGSPKPSCVVLCMRTDVMFHWSLLQACENMHSHFTVHFNIIAFHIFCRLLNFDVDKWVHLNCALWSDDVYETVNGALMNLENSLQQSLVLNCVVCHRTGATIRCFKLRCSNVYHLGCAVKDGCVFFKNKVITDTCDSLL